MQWLPKPVEKNQQRSSWWTLVKVAGVHLFVLQASLEDAGVRNWSFFGQMYFKVTHNTVP